MSNKRNKKKSGAGIFGRLFAQTKLPAHVTEEQDWYLDTPDVRLTRVFTIVLILHVVAVGGILAFKMIEKASAPALVGAAPATSEPKAPDTAPPADRPAQPAAAPAEQPALLVDHASASGYQEYRVSSGDSLVSIARKLNVSVDDLRTLNRLDAGDPLYPGKFLMVPKVTSPAKPAPAKPQSAVAAAEPEKNATPRKPAPAPAAQQVARLERVAAPQAASERKAETAAPATAANGNYVVQKGDTLFGISRKFGMKYQDLMAMNGIDKPENLRAGQSLRVPKN